MNYLWRNVKVLTVLLSFSIMSVNADEFFILNKKEGCYVKSYINKEFYDVPYKKFKGVKLLAGKHKKHPNFMLFKIDEQLYVTKSKCLDKVEYSEESDDILDSTPEEDISRYNKVPSYRLENLKSVDNKWMIELSGGKTFFASKESILSGYNEFDGTYDGDVYTFSGTVEKTKYTGGSLIDVTIGYRYFETGYLSLKFKKYSGKKTETVSGTLNGSPGYYDFDFKESFTSILFGNKFIFFPTSSFRPSIGLYAGISTIESKNEFFDPLGLKFRSTGLSAQIDIGIEYFINHNFSLGINYGLEYLGTRTFKVVDDNDEVTTTGYKTKMDYTNTFASGGIRIYF